MAAHVVEEEVGRRHARGRCKQASVAAARGVGGAAAAAKEAWGGRRAGKHERWRLEGEEGKRNRREKRREGEGRKNKILGTTSVP